MQARSGAALGVVFLLALPVVLAAVPVAGSLTGGGGPNGPSPLAAELPVQVFSLHAPFDYSDTILLGNNNSVMSRNLTFYFQAERGVPDENVLFADLPVGETISEARWNVFAAWFKNETANRSLGSQINYIVTFKGLPIRVSWTGPNGPTSFQDALMLLDGAYEGYIGRAGLYANPYFNMTERFSFAEYGLRLVTGIYAYNESTARDLIDRASSSLGNRGEYVLDTDWSRGYANNSGAAAWGSYQYANSALVWANDTLTARGEATYLDATRTYVTNRSNVMGYASWGSNDCCDHLVTVHSVPLNQWVNGSIAETFVSTGGRTFTWPPSYGQSLIADWIDEGVSGVKGYTNEPYISAIADGHILFARYTRGYNLAESFWAASHVVGWRQIVIGDPKMAPYADIGDLALNGSLTVVPPAVEQFDSIDLTVAVDNTAALARDVDLRVALPGGAVQSFALAAAANSVSVFPLSINLSGVPPEFWDSQALQLTLDPDDTIREWDENNNNATYLVVVRRHPAVTGWLDLNVVQTFEVATLHLNATRADRPIAQYTWSQDGGPWQVLDALSGETSVELSYNRSGAHTFQVFGVDVTGLVSPVAGNISLTVLNRAPQAAASVNASAPISLEPVSFSAASSGDMDGSIVSYAWEAGPLGTWTGPAFEFVFTRPGLFTFNLTVTDDEGAQSNASVVVDVGNRPPEAVATPNVTEARTGEPFAVDASGSYDPDGSVVHYAFEFDGAPEVSGQEPTAAHAFTAPGVAGLWVTVTDDWGATSRVRVTLLVLDRPPAVSWSLTAGETIVEGEGISVQVQVDEPDSDLFSYAVDFGDGAKSDVALAGQHSEFTLTHIYGFEGEYRVTLTVADVEGNQTKLESTVTVVHPAPEATAFSFELVNGTLMVDYAIETPFPDLVTFVVYIDGVAWRTFPASAAGVHEIPVEGLEAGARQVRFEVTDGVKTSVAGAGTITVVEPDTIDDPPPPGGTTPTGGAFDAVPLVLAVVLAAVALAAFVMLRRRRAKPPTED